MFKSVLLIVMVFLLSACKTEETKDLEVIFKKPGTFRTIHLRAFQRIKKDLYYTSVDEFMILNEYVQSLTQNLLTGKEENQTFGNDDLLNNDRLLEKVLYCYISKLLHSDYTVKIHINKNIDDEWIMTMNVSGKNKSLTYTDIPVNSYSRWLIAEEYYHFFES